MSVRDSESAALALRALTREAAELAVPEIDWDRIERRVLSHVEQAAAQAPSPSPAPLPDHRVDVPRRAGSAWAVALAAAAAVALVSAPRSTRSPAGVDSNRSLHETSALESGGDSMPRNAAESGAEPLSYHRAGVVSFALSPESRVEMVASEGAGSMTVTLIRGTIHADVTPRQEGEVFAVEVGHTRVAAHGTSFTVTRQGDQALVQVDHGAVAVGPVGHPGSTQGWLVVGPDRAMFSLDGAREARWLGPPEPPPAKVQAAQPSTPPMAIAPSSPPNRASAIEPSSAAKPAPLVATAPVAPEEKPAAPEAPSPVVRESDAAAAILKGIEACYERQVSSLGVRFSIESSLTLTILPAGTVREGVFNPPLSPTLMTCARVAISSARFPHGESVTQIRVPVRLSPPSDQ